MKKDTWCGLSIVILQISAKFLFCLNYICPYRLPKYCYLFNLLIHCDWSSWVYYVTFFILNLLLYRNIVSISKIFLDLSMLQQMYSILLFFKTQKNSPWWICTLDFPPWIIAKLCCYGYLLTTIINVINMDKIGNKTQIMVSVLSGRCPESELAEHTSALYVSRGGNFSFSIVAGHTNSLPPSVYMDTSLFTVLSIFDAFF